MGTLIKPESVTDVILTVTMTSETGKDPDVVARVVRDCDPATGDLKTKVRVLVEQVIVDVFGYDVSIGSIEVDEEVACELPQSPQAPQVPQGPQTSPQPQVPGIFR